MDEKLTRKSQEALSEAVQMAASAGNPSTDGLHLLAALVQQDGGTARRCFALSAPTRPTCSRQVQDQLARMPQAAGATVSAPETSRQLLAALATASKLAREMSDEYVSTEHLLVGLATDGGQTAAAAARRPAPGPSSSPTRSSRSAAMRG